MENHDFSIKGLIISLILLIGILGAGYGFARIYYPAVATIGEGDITGTMIKDHDVTGDDIATTTSLTIIGLTVTNATATKLIVNSDGTIGGTLTVSGTSTLATTTAAKLTINNDLTVSGTADIGTLKTATTTQGAIYYVNSAGEMAALAPGTSGYYLKTQGAGNNPIWDTLTVEETQNPIIASETLRHSNDAEKSLCNDSWTKVKEIKINCSEPITGPLRIKFDLRGQTGNETCYGRIYRNGSPVGTERSTNSTSWTTFSEDIDGWQDNDLIQLYIRIFPADALMYARNFRIYGDADYKKIIKIGSTDIASDSYIKTATTTTYPTFTNTQE